MSRDKTTTGDLTLLGNKGTKYDDKYNPAVLETFDNMHPGNEYVVSFDCRSSTSSASATRATSTRTA